MNRTNGTSNHASPLTMVSNLADFGNDIATLAELQAKLAAHDAKECAGRAAVPVVALVLGGIVALGSIPVILIGLADLIATYTKLSAGATQLIVGLAALALAGIGAFVGMKGATRSLDSFRRSREELVRNMSWIRTVVVFSGRNAGKRRV